MAIASTASAYIFFFKWVEIGVYFYLRELWGFILVVIRNIESRVFAKIEGRSNIKLTQTVFYCRLQ